MTIHRHNLSNSHLSQLSSLSRCASVESVSNFGSNSTTRTQSSVSLASMLSSLASLATTPNYSPTLIQTEVGDLLNIDDLELEGAEIIDDDKEEEGEQEQEQPQDYYDDSDRDSVYDYFDKGYESSETTDADVQGGSQVTAMAPPSPPMSPQTEAFGRTSSNSIDEILCGSATALEEPRYDPSKVSYREKWFICLIGLPACGKSTVVRELIDFARINTTTETNAGVRIQSFNAGDVRRLHEQNSKKKFSFDLSDERTQKVRELYAFEALKQLTDGLVNDTVDVGILDATNTTRARRESVFKQVNKVSQQSHIRINTLILEVKCCNKSLRRFNIEQKANNKDYNGTPKDQAIVDFLNRIEKYEKIYEPVTLKEINQLGAKYFSITNAGESVCYDCGLVHHNTKRHQHLTFKSVALNLIYDFLMSYRCMYAIPYLKQVEDFYTKGYYRPVITAHSSSSSLANEATTKGTTPTTLMKVLSAPRIS
ncbi:DEKNAAC103578 [Brettanomyces naardenensis]|uniref:DEKNAAC103578 n=1 Tax=Brettanomyces naardenensis TaxID=13370 RepID=A0A448YNN8_BRENA|nr:DEKNAAC103578 [Brettanomyces naardenensis]